MTPHLTEFPGHSCPRGRIYHGRPYWNGSDSRSVQRTRAALWQTGQN